LLQDVLHRTMWTIEPFASIMTENFLLKRNSSAQQIIVVQTQENQWCMQISHQRTDTVIAEIKFLLSVHSF
jgi:hypothetical protein